MKSLKIMLIPFIALLLAACQEDSSDSGENAEPVTNQEQQGDGDQADKSPEQEDKDEDEEEQKAINSEILEGVPAAPATVQDVINQKQGQFGDVGPYQVEDQIKEEISKLDPLPENADEETKRKYFNYLYSLVARDFPNPDSVLKKWEFASSGNPELPNSKYSFKENYNIEVILDASGSMAAKVNGKTRMELAKQSIQNFLSDVPEEANVSLRVYGHKGSSSDSDKELSCSSIEQVYSFQSYNKDEFSKALDQFEPKGWTPIADALKESNKTMEQFDSETNTNLIYLVSDGIETCGGNPVQVAEQFSESDAQPIINIIGFQADQDAQAQLQNVAQASDGVYTTVSDQQGLEEEFNRAKEVLEAWKDWKGEALNDADAKDVEHSFDILGLTNEWGTKADGQKSDFGTVLYFAKEVDVLNQKQHDKFREWQFDTDEIIRDAKRQVEAELEKVNTQKIEELKKSIEEKFSENTDNAS